MLRSIVYFTFLTFAFAGTSAFAVDKDFLTKIEIVNREPSAVGKTADEAIKSGNDELTEVGEVVDWQVIFLDLVNTHRKKLGLKKLLPNESITALATQHSKDMTSKSRQFGHEGFAERCSVISAEFGGTQACGENVGFGDDTPESVFKSWLSSEKHKAHIENPNFTHSGFGYSLDVSGTFFWTHLMVGQK